MVYVIERKEYQCGVCNEIFQDKGLAEFHCTKVEKERIEKISIKDRTHFDHQFMINKVYSSNIRDYLLSLGEFKTFH